MRSVVNLVRSQVYDTERPPYLLQHVRHDAARRAGLPAIADPCFLYSRDGTGSTFWTRADPSQSDRSSNVLKMKHFAIRVPSYV